MTRGLFNQEVAFQVYRDDEWQTEFTFMARIYKTGGIEQYQAARQSYDLIMWVVATRGDVWLFNQQVGGGDMGPEYDLGRVYWTDPRGIHHEARITAVRQTSSGRRLEILVQEAVPNILEQPDPDDPPGPVPPELQVKEYQDAGGGWVTDPNIPPPEGFEGVWYDGYCQQHWGELPEGYVWVGGGCF